jgi:LysR family transcriptional regulator, positive regulator for ilvC
LDNRDLRVFMSMASTLHFGRAGRECALSPSAVSRTIGRLEEELGRRLFDRDKRSVELRPEGAALLAYARETLGAWEDLKAALAEGEELKGEIRIYSSVAASYTVLDRLFPEFRRAYPDVHVRLRTGDAAEALDRIIDGSADVAVAALPGSLPRNLLFRTVVTTPLVFIAPAMDCEASILTKKNPVPWESVPMVLTETGLSRKRADAWFRLKGAKQRIYAEVSGHEAVISMVSLGCGAGIVPRIVLDRFGRTGEVRVIPVTESLEPYVIGLCAPKRRLASKVVRAFWDMAGAGRGARGGKAVSP